MGTGRNGRSILKRLHKAESPGTAQPRGLSQCLGSEKMDNARRAAGKYAAERQIQTESGNPFTHGFHGKPALTAFTGKRSPGETDSCGGNARAHQSLRKQERPLPPWGKRGKNRPRQGS